MKKTQSGFTLIELIVVIVILGILAATALPKFIDLTGDAGTAAASGIAGAIASGSAINYGAKVAGNASATAVNAANVCTTAILGNFLNSSGMTLVSATPANDKEFKVSGTGDCSGTATTVTCTITPKSGTAASAMVTCAR